MTEETKKRIRIYASDEVIETGNKATANVGPRTDVRIDNGFKCEHGVYIPSTAVSRDHAPYCSLCYPYIVKLREE